MMDIKELHLIPTKKWPINLWRKLHDDSTLIDAPKNFESRLCKCTDAGIICILHLNIITLKYKYNMPAREIGRILEITTSEINELIRSGILLIKINGMSIIDDDKKDVLNMTMRDIGMCTRLSNALNRCLGSYGHELTVSELLTHSQSELLDNPYNRIGVMSIKEIKEILSKYGLEMKE